MSDNHNHDKREILNQTRALAANPDLFYSHLISSLSETLTLEQFQNACTAALESTTQARSFHED